MTKRRIEWGKGFTLVELIIVLVILAVFVAMLIPSLLGYIQKARQSTYLINAHNAIQAAEWVIAEEYAAGTSFDSWRGFTNITDRNADIQDRIYALSGVDRQEYVIANVDVNAKGQLIFMNFYSVKTYGGDHNRLVYLNGTIGGNTYESELLFTCWNGEEYYAYRSMDPAQVGYQKP